MKTSDFANKQFAVYGMGFRGNNVKTIGIGIGYNTIWGKDWGSFYVDTINDEVIFNYNFFDNFYLVRRLVDRKFKLVPFDSDSLPCWLVASLCQRNLLLSETVIIEARAYWWKFRLFKFWMVQIKEENGDDYKRANCDKARSAMRGM
jgi:hypothetical protein